jgi:hypothetical protein
MKKISLEDRVRVEQFTDDFIPEGVIKAPDEILDILAFFQKDSSGDNYIYKVPFPSSEDLDFAECCVVDYPFQHINKGDYVVTLTDVYSCVMNEKSLLHLIDLLGPYNYSMDINTIFSINSEDSQIT